MKNIIAITSLFAAGTLCASAAGTLVYYGDTGAGSDIFSASQWGYSTLFYDYTENATRDDGKTLTTSTWADANSSVDSYKTAMQTVGNTDFSLRFDPTIAMSAATSVAFGISSAIYLDSFDVGSAAPTSFTLDFGTSGSITAKSKLNFGASVKDVDGSINIVASGITAGAERLLLSTENQYGIWNLSDATSVTLTVDGYDTSLGLVESGTVLSEGQAALVYKNKALYLVSGIPEPSAFGLLAGLGALALAGTRRRRRK
ncbi:PEP-CTERM sorting domain-containing protein [Candidatus Spyradosoma sp. SGI.093]|uniref:PEP-CTERM sorting domain-containing protein n=1 Tax=Candidatus Spyradosoma sp. SGI.093 TaxID=3420583 RepID=UPI003D054BEF